MDKILYESNIYHSKNTITIMEYDPLVSQTTSLPKYNSINHTNRLHRMEKTARTQLPIGVGR